MARRAPGPPLPLRRPLLHAGRCALRCAAVLTAATFLPALSGCTALGAAAGKFTTIVVKPAYIGFQNQTVGVMVAADRGLLNDFPALQIDIARGVQKKLEDAAKVGTEELKGTRFPRGAAPDAILTFQHNYPSLMYEPITDVAPKLGVSRLIYVEVDNLQTHPEAVPELFRGNLSARVQVVEVANGKARSVFETRVQANYPERSPQEGMPNLGEGPTYRGAVDAFTTAVLEKFVPHEERE